MNIRADVRKFVTETFLFGLGEELLDDTSFIDGGIVDSTGILQLVGFLEETYGISVGDADLIPDNLDSVQRVVQFVERKVSSKAFVSSSALSLES